MCCCTFHRNITEGYFFVSIFIPLDHFEALDETARCQPEHPQSLYAIGQNKTQDSADQLTTGLPRRPYSIYFLLLQTLSLMLIFSLLITFH